MEVEGDEFGVVRCFPYLCDMLDGGGGADAAVSARIRCGWKKFQGMVPFLSWRAPSLKMKGQVFNACVRSALLYESEAWPMTIDERKIARADSRMMRHMCGVRLAGRATQEELRILTGLEVVGDVMMRRRLRCHVTSCAMEGRWRLGKEGVERLGGPWSTAQGSSEEDMGGDRGVGLHEASLVG